MKTLDEVIKNLEDGTEHLSVMLISRETWTDALQWLKGYKAHIELDKLRDKCEAENEPLSWDELKQMEGKPVWVESLLYKQWAVIAYIGEEYIRFEGANLYALECRIYMGEDNGWQAYRKERG